LLFGRLPSQKSGSQLGGGRRLQDHRRAPQTSLRNSLETNKMSQTLL